MLNICIRVWEQDMQVGIVALVQYLSLIRAMFEVDPRGGYIAKGYAGGALRLIVEAPDR